MNDFIELLTSQEAMIVYIVIAIASILCFIIYLVDRNRINARKRHNTKELNKLVEQIQEEVPSTVSKEVYEKPIMQSMEASEASTSIDEMLQYTAALYQNTYEDEVVEELPELIESKPITVEPLKEKEVVNETVPMEETISIVEPTKKEENTLEYTNIELNEEEAKKELQQLTEELQNEPSLDNEVHTSFEEEQEQTAIISLQELLSKSKAMYEANEITQYEDENTVPISIGELEEQVGRESTPYKDSFVLENVVEEDESIPVLEPVEEDKKFKSSPIISPVYGIEKKTDISLENTANYEKFDREKNNEFLMTLKELQENVE